MDDLISRQAAINMIEKYFNGLPIAVHYDMLAVVHRLPSAQSEIIRCKDCKHYQFADNRAFGMPVKMCTWSGFEDVDDNDFCSRAERRTDG